MKIDKFQQFQLNEKSKFKPTDKILRVKFDGVVNVLLEDVEKTDSYQRYFNSHDINGARYYGLEEYLYNSGDIKFDYNLADGDGNPIEDEKAFDEYAKNIEKYNL